VAAAIAVDDGIPIGRLEETTIAIVRERVREELLRGEISRELRPESERHLFPPAGKSRTQNGAGRERAGKVSRTDPSLRVGE
jgi:hypothetical protein